MLSKSTLAFSIVALLNTVSAQIKITQPGGPDFWWVAKYENTLAWTCHDAEDNGAAYTVLLENKNKSIINETLPLFTSIPNYDCSKLIPSDSMDVPVGDGYTITLADPLNRTNIYATSEEFEIKPAGSPYPSASTTVQPPPATSSVSSQTTATNSPSPTGAASNSPAPGENGAMSRSSGYLAVYLIGLGTFFLYF